MRNGEGLIIGVDLGGTKMHAAVVDASGHVIHSLRQKTVADEGADAVIGRIAGLIRDITATLGAEPRDVTAVCVGVPGGVDDRAGVVDKAPNLKWEKVPLARLLSDAIGGGRVFLDNDVRVAVLGEHAYGCGRGTRTMVGIFVGTGGHPRWELAGGGYLFDVVDPQRVEVLMKSKEVAERYNSSGVIGVRFKVGDGQVVHVSGHFFTQPGQRPEVAAAGQAFEQLSANVVTEKRAQKAELDKLYDAAPRREVALQSAPAPAAAPVAAPEGGTASIKKASKLRVLGRKGGYANVRDDQGNEGWVPADAL